MFSSVCSFSCALHWHSHSIPVVCSSPVLAHLWYTSPWPIHSPACNVRSWLLHTALCNIRCAFTSFNTVTVGHGHSESLPGLSVVCSLALQHRGSKSAPGPMPLRQVGSGSLHMRKDHFSAATFVWLTVRQQPKTTTPHRRHPRGSRHGSRHGRRHNMVVMVQSPAIANQPHLPNQSVKHSRAARGSRAAGAASVAHCALGRRAQGAAVLHWWVACRQQISRGWLAGCHTTYARPD